MDEDPDWEMMGFCPQGKDPGFGEFVGKVSKVLPVGCAFIECQEIKDLYDQDAYVHSSVMHQCGLQLGDEICFNVHVNATGRPQVSAPCWKRKRGWKRPWTEMQAEAQDVSAPAAQGKFGGKSVAKGSNGSWKPPAEEVPKVSRVQIPWGSSKADPGKGKGLGKSPVSAVDNGADAGEFLIGTIKIADPARGFSMISCPDSGFEADVYIHSAIASPENFAVRDVVAFTFHMNEKGQPRADVVFRLSGFVPAGKTASFPPNMGTVTRVLGNGSGFIDCPEVSEVYGKDVFVHGSVVEQCGLKTGDVLAFDVHVSKDGNPQVSAPCWIQAAAGNTQERRQSPPVVQLPAKGSYFSPSGKGQQPLSKGKGYGAGPGLGLASGPKVTLSKGGTMRVEAPTSGPPKGASSPAAFQPSGCGGKGKLGKQAGKPAPSAPGKGMKGKIQLPQAWNAQQAPGGAPRPGPGRDTWSMKASANHIDSLDIDWMAPDFHAGRVSLIDLEKFVSLVRCPASGFSRDVYVHQSVADPGALSLNDVVCFKVHMNSKGLPQASAPFWKRVGIESSESFARFGEFQGLVVRSEDGPISIDCPDVTQLHGRDAVMQEESADLCQLVEGNLICFDVSVNQGGDPEVIPPCWICCSSEKWVKDIVGKGEEG